MSPEATDHATKGLLIGAIGPIGKMAPLAFLGGVGVLDFRRQQPTLVRLEVVAN